MIELDLSTFREISFNGVLSIMKKCHLCSVYVGSGFLQKMVVSYQHDGDADKHSYLHSAHVDENSYPHEGRYGFS